MSETLYNVLELSGPTHETTFREVFGDQYFSSPSNDSVRLSEQQFRAFVKVLFTFGMHYDEVLEEQRPLFLKSILENERNLFGISETFCEHLMNNLDETGIIGFNVLQKMEWNINEPLSNELLMDFVEMELMDPTLTYRKWEYGRYALDQISRDFFNDMDWEQYRDSFDGQKLGTQNYLGVLEDEMSTSKFDLDDHEKTLLQLVVKSKLEPKKTTLPEYLMAGEIVQSNLVGLNLRKKKLEDSLHQTLRNQRSSKRGKGGPKL